MGLFDSYFDSEDARELIDIKPFHTVKDKSKQDLLKWLNDAVDSIMKHNKTRHQKLKANLNMYRGYKHEYEKATPRREYIPQQRKREELLVNHLFDLVETKVSQLNRLKPSFEILPKNDEFADKNSARASKLLLDHFLEKENFDSVNTMSTRHRKIFGENYLFIEWDEDKGDLHPKAGTLDAETGETVDENLKVGDVKYEIEVPWRVLNEPVDYAKDPKYCFRIKIEHVEDLKKKYPDKEIKADTSAIMFDYSTLQSLKLKDQTIVYEFYHKETPDCKSQYIKFIKNTILEQEEEKYSHGQIPYIKQTDIDIPGLNYGVAHIEAITGLQNRHDKLSSLIFKNIWLTNHPKWMVPHGAAKIESLGNDATIVSYKGPVAPQLATFQGNSSEVYSFRDSLERDMQKIYSVGAISRGEPPTGITAAVALQFLNEQESERASTDVAKFNDFVRDVAKMTLAVMGDYYETGDNRTIRILGKENRYLLRHFDASNLSKPYDIKVDLGNALADSKPAQIQRIIELVQYKPDAFSGEQLVDLLDLGKANKAVSQITAAVRTAESEVEDMMEGKEVAEPEPYEDLIVHWRVKVKAIQSRSFKEEVPPEIRKIVKENIRMVEFLMIEKAKENPKFQSEVAQLSLFPIFYKDKEFSPQSAAQQEATVQGQSNRGEDITGSIPATNPAPLPNEPNS